MIEINEDIRSLVALSLVKNVGTSRVRMLMSKVNRPGDIFSLNAHQIQQVPGIGETTTEYILTFDDWEKVDELLNQTERSGARLIPFFHEYYPERLRQIYDSPLLLWLKGNPEALNQPGLAIIGTRQPTSYGVKMAEEYTKMAVQHKFAVFSGLAYGIDTVAHKTAVEHGGVTVAVLGSGIDIIYPSKNTALADKIIAENGAVISELQPGAQPDAQNFPERNRIVSGLSLGTLVVETPLKGGSRITAHLALDQNREVFVIPHNLDNERGIGCNDLIKKGYGKLVQSFDDILEEIPIAEKLGVSLSREDDAVPVHIEDTMTQRWEEEGLDEVSQEICKMIQKGIHQIDDIAERLEMKSHEILVQLLDLEFQGLVRQKAGKKFELR